MANTENQSEISSTKTEFGYDQAKITEGKNLWTETRSVFDFNKTEDDETNAAHDAWGVKLEELEDS